MQADPEQEYPKGQHWPPQLGKVAVRLVVSRVASLCNVMFCSWILQLTGAIMEQSLPFGQQSNVVLLASTKHVVDAGQQNPDGTPLHCVSPERQVNCLSNRSCAGAENAMVEPEKAIAKTKRLNIRKHPIVRLSENICRKGCSQRLCRQSRRICT